MTSSHDGAQRAHHVPVLEVEDDATPVSVPGPVHGILLPVFVSLVVGALFVAVYLTAFHQPTPRSMPVGVVGTQQIVSEVGDALDEVEPGYFDVVRYATAEDATAAVTSREVYGAFDPTSGELVVAGANGSAVQGALQGALTPVADSEGVTLDTTDVLPLSTGDSRGLSIFYAAFGLVLAGFLFGVNSYTAAPHLRLGQRLVSLGLFGVLGGAVISLIAGPTGFNAIPGNFAAVGGVIALIAIAVGAATMVTLRLAGPVGTPIAVVLLLILGNATSGGVLPVVYLPGWMFALSHVLPVGAGVRALQGVAYFGGAGVASGLLVAAAWILACVALLYVMDRSAARRRRSAPASAAHGGASVG